MYRMPTLPILQMSGRRDAYHLGEPQSPPMTSMRTLRIPLNPSFRVFPPPNTPLFIRKALILRIFIPYRVKIRWYFGGIYRHVFRGYR